MAQSRAKRNQRAKRRGTVPAGPSPSSVATTRRRRRFVLAFLVLIGLAGIIAFATPGDSEGGAPPGPAVARGG